MATGSNTLPSAPAPTGPPAGLPTARAVDHYAFTVPDLEEAVDFFTEVLGGELCYREGPVQDPHGDRMTRKLGVHPRARAHVALLRLGPYSNVELFEYSAPGQISSPPGPDDVGGHHLGLCVADPDTAEGYLRSRGVEWLGTTAGTHAGPGERRWFLSPWGMLFALCAPLPSPAGPPGRFVPPLSGAGPDGDRRALRLLGVDHVGYTVADLDTTVDFFTAVLGAEVVDRTYGDRPEDHGGLPFRRPPGARQTAQAVLRTGPTANCELSLHTGDTGRKRPPRNSDVGGHHLAFYVDDVDAAAAFLRGRPGVRLMGEPETITEGPIAGDRWLYFTTPTGIQMELINMPDGSLPYEAETTARRATPGRLRWHDRP